jgi:hypothetical protein
MFKCEKGEERKAKQEDKYGVAKGSLTMLKMFHISRCIDNLYSFIFSADL